MQGNKICGKTARQWLVDFAVTAVQKHGFGGHQALESVWSDAHKHNRKTTTLGAAASHYESGLTSLQLERLIREVERKAKTQYNPYRIEDDKPYRLIWRAIGSETQHTEYYANAPSLYRRKRELRARHCAVWLHCRHADGSWIDM